MILNHTEKTLNNLIEIAKNATNIPGWMILHDLWLLAFLAFNTTGRALEIGCWGGRSTRAMLDAFSGSTFTAVDPFVVNFNLNLLTPENTSGLHGLSDNIRNEIINTKSSRPLFDSVMKKSSQFDKLRVFQEKSKDYALRNEPKADLIFIDGDHSTEGFKHDIKLAMKLISTNGIIAGHDYTVHHPKIFAVLDRVKRTSGRFILTLPKSDIFLFLPINCALLINLLAEYDKVDVILNS